MQKEIVKQQKIEKKLKKELKLLENNLLLLKKNKIKDLKKLDKLKNK